MSRPYRVRVSQSLRRIVSASDRVTSKLEMLPILEVEELAAILENELARSGFEQSEQGDWVRQVDEAEVRVDARSGEISVALQSRRELRLETESTGSTYDPQARRQVEARLKRQLQKQLDDEARSHQSELDKVVAERLENVLREVHPELDRIVNRATGEALKKKASRMGRVKEISEDDRDGSLTIVVEL